MANPRHKMPKRGKRTRRAHDVLTPASKSVCPRCNAQKLPHRVCGNCGYYKGVSKITVEA
jgi:large subunit ribosomal protein L32